jgi:hypothetical protein
LRLLIAQKDVHRRLRHANIGVTLDLSSHVTCDVRRHGADV